MKNTQCFEFPYEILMDCLKIINDVSMEAHLISVNVNDGKVSFSITFDPMSKRHAAAQNNLMELIEAFDDYERGDLTITMEFN